MAQDLDAIGDINHISYKLPGALTWLTLGVTAVGVWAWQDAVVLASGVLLAYLIVRLLLNISFYVVGMLRCKRWEAAYEESACGTLQGSSSVKGNGIQHVVIIPMYREPIETLRNTLEALATQYDASSRVNVVLAVEARDPAGWAKAESILPSFKDRFLRIMTTSHPANLRGEVAGKGSNESWAARKAKEELVDRLGLPLESLIVTVCDVDAVLHPAYLSEVERLFVSDPDRHSRFWYAPTVYHNNIREVPAVIRLLSFQSEAVRLGELANPLSWPLPISVYTLSLQLAHDVGYWDPAVISEDWHMYLRCFFALRGKLRLVRVYLATSVDAVDGGTLWATLVSYYHQQVRHSWGAEDVGYILQQWGRRPGMPLRQKIRALTWILHHHLLRSTAWFVTAFGLLAAFRSRSAVFGFLELQRGAGWVVRDMSVVAGCALVLWLFSCLWRRAIGMQIGLRALLSELAAWALIPWLALVFTTVPGVVAQTRLLWGKPLQYRRTVKQGRPTVQELT